MSKKDFNSNPKKCTKCNSPISYEKRRNKFCSYLCYKSSTNSSKEYNSNPKKCYYCHSFLPYEKRRNNFCNHSCSASYTNIGKFHSQETKNKISKGILKKFPKKIEYPSCKVYFLPCVKCSSLTVCKRNRRIYCKSCNKIDKIRYKRESSFKLNKRDHPELFDSTLIKEYGWFVSSGPNKNRKGLTWDHLYPLHLGFENSVDSSIMSHPANAELVPYDENLRRYRDVKYMISYEELLDRIAKWNNGDRNLQYFYKE